MSLLKSLKSSTAKMWHERTGSWGLAAAAAVCFLTSCPAHPLPTGHQSPGRACSPRFWRTSPFGTSLHTRWPVWVRAPPKHHCAAF